MDFTTGGDEVIWWQARDASPRGQSGAASSQLGMVAGVWYRLLDRCMVKGPSTTLTRRGESCEATLASGSRRKATEPGHQNRGNRSISGQSLISLAGLCRSGSIRAGELLAVLAGIAVEQDRPVDAVVAADQQRGTAGEQAECATWCTCPVAPRPVARPSHMRSKPASAAPWVRGPRLPAAARAWSECCPRSGRDIVSGRPGRRRSGPGPPPRRSSRRWHPSSRCTRRRRAGAPAGRSSVRRWPGRCDGGCRSISLRRGRGP